MKKIVLLLIVLCSFQVYSQEDSAYTYIHKREKKNVIKLDESNYQFYAGMELQKASNYFYTGLSLQIGGVATAVIGSAIAAKSENTTYVVKNVSTPIYITASIMFAAGTVFEIISWGHVGKSGKIFMKSNQIGYRYTF